MQRHFDLNKYSVDLKSDHARRLDQYLKSEEYGFSSQAETRRTNLATHKDGWRYIEVVNNRVYFTGKSGAQLDGAWLFNLDIDPNKVYPNRDVKTCLKYQIKKILKRMHPSLGAFLQVGPGFGLDPEIYIYCYAQMWDEIPGAINSNDISKRHKIIHYERVQAYNYYNEVSPYIKRLIVDSNLKSMKILEIGPGVGNLALVVKLHLRELPKEYFLVDLPEALPFSILHLMYQFPEEEFVLPNEVCGDTVGDVAGRDKFIFLTPQQIDDLSDEYFDVGINTNSFAEMPSDCIAVYFRFLRRSLKKENVFFTVNRAEKAMDCSTGASIATKIASQRKYIEQDKSIEINRFSEYPWSDNDLIYAFHRSDFNACRFGRDFFLKTVKMHTTYNKNCSADSFS